MNCPFCGHLEDKVVDSRESREGDAIRRRRQCLAVLTDGRTTVAALAVGLAQACVDESVAYASERGPFGLDAAAFEASVAAAAAAR